MTFSEALLMPSKNWQEFLMPGCSSCWKPTCKCVLFCSTQWAQLTWATKQTQRVMSRDHRSSLENAINLVALFLCGWFHHFRAGWGTKEEGETKGESIFKLAIWNPAEKLNIWFKWIWSNFKNYSAWKLGRPVSARQYYPLSTLQMFDL